MKINIDLITFYKNFQIKWTLRKPYKSKKSEKEKWI